MISTALRCAIRRAALAATLALGLHSLAASSAPEAPRLESSAPQSHRSEPQRAPFAFALIGDIPYNALEARMIESLFASFDSDVLFAIHIGDVKASWERCDDALLGARLALLDTSPVPLIYVPGDNDWTDCGRSRAGAFDPRERLDWLRKRVFRVAAPMGAQGRLSDDSPFVDLERQADRRADGLPENLRWRHGKMRFVTLNVPGSNNGLAADGLDGADWRSRHERNAHWLRETYALAEREHDVAVVVVVHANVRFDRDADDAVVGRDAGAGRSEVMTVDRLAGRTDGYAAFRALLFHESRAFPGPTLFLHGDTHHHSVERLAPKLLRVESYGSPFANFWVRIEVDPEASDPFKITSRRLDQEPPPP